MHYKVYVLVARRTSPSQFQKANYRQLHHVRTTTRLTGVDFKGWSIFRDGGTHTVDVNTTAGWDAVARSVRGECMSCWAQSFQQKQTWRVLGKPAPPLSPLASHATGTSPTRVTRLHVLRHAACCQQGKDATALELALHQDAVGQYTANEDGSVVSWNDIEERAVVKAVQKPESESTPFVVLLPSLVGLGNPFFSRDCVRRDTDLTRLHLALAICLSLPSGTPSHSRTLTSVQLPPLTHHRGVCPGSI